MKEKFDFSKVHFTPDRFRNPIDKVSICLIGCGGTGSQVAMALARINYALINTGHPGLEVVIFDIDSISASNIGRQLFSESEIGLPKSVAIANRINRFFGFDWQGIHGEWKGYQSNITITCVDNVKTRWQIKNRLVWTKKNAEQGHITFGKRQYYWLDTGNDYDFGQIVLGTCRRFKQPTKKSVKWLPNIFDLHPDFDMQERENKPSCSLAMSLQHQDLFVNSIVASYTGHLLWKLLTKEYLTYNALYINLDSMKCSKRNL